MNTRPLVIVVVACVAGAALFGFGIGRATAPVKVVETKQEQKAAHAGAYQMQADQGWRMDKGEVTHTVWKIKRVYLPTGELASEELETEQGKQTKAVEVTTTVTTAEAKETSAYQGSLRVSVREPATRWTLTALAGSTWDWRREYGGTISFRVAGPFSIGVYGTNHALGAGVSLSW